jgi:DNA primase
MEFVLDRRVSGFDLTSAEGQTAAVNAVLPLLSAVENAITRQRCAERLARRVALPTDAILRELGRHVRGGRRDPVVPALRPRSLPSGEWKLIHLALHHPGAADRAREALRAEDVEDEILRRIFQFAVAGPGTTRGRAPLSMEEPEVQRVLTELLATDLEEYEGEEGIARAVSDCLSWVNTRRARRDAELLQRRIDEAERGGDHAAVERLQAELLALRKDRSRGAVHASP